MSKNYLIYPCKVMRITQSYTGTISHLPHTTGNPKDYPIDEGCKDTGRDYIYCPCDKMTVKRIYGVGTGGTNTIWLESTEEVYFADGTKGYFTMLITHPNDDDLKKIKVGQIFKRKEPVCREGKDGATAYHLHISAGKGRFSGNGWTKNSKNKYVLTTTSGTEKPEKLFYIDKSFTTVKADKGLGFRNLPEEKYTVGTYVVNTAVLNVRKNASTAHKRVGILTKGKKVKIISVTDNWGKYKENRWICLDYCKRVSE